MSRSPNTDETEPRATGEEGRGPDGAVDSDHRDPDAVDPGTADSDEPEASIEALIDAGEVHPAAVAALRRAEARAKEAEDRMLRAVAESQNERRRLAKEQADRIRYGNESLLGELLPVLDNLELCLAHAGGDASLDNLRTGVEMTLTQFRQAMQSVGVEPIEVEVGAPFDPKLHDAVLQDDGADLPARTIAKVMQTGFTYRERVMRPTKVVVSTGKGQKS